MNFREKYHKYLESPQWSRLRGLVWDRAKGMCERCGEWECSATHHLSYKNVFDERLHELQCVCSGCHEYLHARSPVDPLAYKSDPFTYLQKKLAEI